MCAIENKIYVSTHHIRASRQNWSIEQTCLELKVSISSFLNISETVTLDQFCKEVLKNFAKIYWKRSVIKYQAKGVQCYWKDTPTYVFSEEFRKSFKNNYLVERQPTATFETSSKI